MNELTDISTVWVTGNFESSFTTTLFLHDEVGHLTLNTIVLVGQKKMTDAMSYQDELPTKAQCSNLGIELIQGLEVFPLITDSYPLDLARKMNAYEVKVLNPVFSDIREVQGVRHGKIQAKLVCRLKRLNEPSNKSNLNQPKLTVLVDKNFNNDSILSGTERNVDTNQNLIKNRGCFSNQPMVSIPAQGCLSSTTVGGCNPFGGLGCGGLLGIFMLLSLVSGLVKTCQHQANTEDKKIEEVKTDTIDISENEVFILSSVQFYTNSDKLLPSSHKDLDRLSLYLLEHPASKVEISGHTDNRGNDRWNMVLSQNRANAVKKYLVKKGIDALRILAIGRGETEPIASNRTKEGMLMNRRVEIRLVKNFSNKE